LAPRLIGIQIMARTTYLFVEVTLLLVTILRVQADVFSSQLISKSTKRITKLLIRELLAELVLQGCLSKPRRRENRERPRNPPIKAEALPESAQIPLLVNIRGLVITRRGLAYLKRLNPLTCRIRILLYIQLTLMETKGGF
jgi:hypothetical protein